MKDHAITARKNISPRDGMSQGLSARLRGAASDVVSRAAEPMETVEAEASSYFYRPTIGGSLGSCALRWADSCGSLIKDHANAYLGSFRAAPGRVPAQPRAPAGERISDARRGDGARSRRSSRDCQGRQNRRLDGGHDHGVSREGPPGIRQAESRSKYPSEDHGAG